MLKKLLGILSLVIIAALASAAPASAGEGETLVFAAASTTNAVRDICALFQAQGLGEAVPSFASSSTLAKQIESGAPAGVFISADKKWMDYLDEKGLIKKDSRSDLLGNRLVLIGSLDCKLSEVEIKPGFPLADLLGDNKLSLGDPDHVPVGIYAKQALEKLGAWSGVEARIARAKDVRASLAMVERGECPLGVVYSTDAAISDKVRVLGLFPEDSHPPIVYPVALTAEYEADPTARAFIKFLAGPEARAVFEKYGFSVRR
ncbi:MAG: molybdate ABC transporter substrate-binding protein [Pseudomonadota bacterium]